MLTLNPESLADLETIRESDVNFSKKSRSTRDNILDAALNLFSKKGYLGATTREIAAEAGIAEVTLFRHFSSKEKLLEEVMSRHSFLPALKKLLPEVLELPYEEGLKVIATRLLDTLLLIKDWIRIINTEVQRSPEKLHTIFHSFLDELFDAFAAYFNAMQQKGILRKFDPELGARAFHGIFFCYFNIEELLMRKNYKATDREMAIREFVDIFARGTLR